jgi:tripartite-type tricarboxylate transporter receptor subunit TctC
VESVRIHGAIIALFLGFAALLLSTGRTLSDRYPNRPIRLLVPYPAGGGADFVARLVAQALGERLGQQVFVDNRSGAGGTIGTAIAAKAPPDGHTLYLAAANLAWGVSLFENLSFDPLRDFSEVALLAKTPSILAVHPSLPAKSVKALIDAAKANPGKINYAGGTGTSMQTDMELFKAMAGIDLAQIPYRGTAPAVLAILSGEVSVIIAPTTSVLPHIRSGALRALAVSSGQRISTLADLPTVTESGVPGFETYQWYGIFVPRRTPAEIVTRLNQALAEIMTAPNITTILASQALAPAPDRPEEFAAFFREQIAKWAAVLKPFTGPAVPETAPP